MCNDISKTFTNNSGSGLQCHAACMVYCDFNCFTAGFLFSAPQLNILQLTTILQIQKKKCQLTYHSALPLKLDL